MEAIMAKQSQKFDVSAFLARENQPKRSLFGTIADKLDDIGARTAHRAGRITESFSGLSDIYTLGTKEGEIDAGLRVRRFEEATAARIAAKLKAAGVECA
jgi:hypothetical protein